MDLVLEAGDGGYDLRIDGYDLATEAGLRSAVIVSLFSDARAAPEDVQGGEDRRGWWADAWPEVAEDETGSLLWLLGRSKTTTEVLRQAEEHAEQALAWLVEDEVASQISATAERVQRDHLALTIDIMRPSGEAMQLRFEDLWKAALNAV